MVFTLYGVWLPTVLSVPKVGSNGSKLYATRRNAHVNFVYENHSHSWKIFAGKASDSLFQSSTATASDKVLVPGTENEETLFSTEESEVPEIASDRSQKPVINTYANFRDDMLPRIQRLGYNVVQIMAIQEHSYYANFGGTFLTHIQSYRHGPTDLFSATCNSQMINLSF